MTGFRGWVIALVSGLAIGAGAGAGAVAWLDHHRDAAIDARARELAAGSPLDDRRIDRIESTLADLAEDGVSVSDDGRYLLDEAGERAIEQAVAANPEHVYVVVWARDQQLGVSEYEAVDLLTARLAAQPGVERGVLFLWQGPQQGFVEDVGPERYYGDVSSSQDFVGDPGVLLPRVVRNVTAASWYDYSSDDGSDYWGGLGGGSLLGLMIAVAVVLVLRSGAFLVRLVGGPRLPGSWRPGATSPTTRARNRKAKP